MAKKSKSSSRPAAGRSKAAKTTSAKAGKAAASKPAARKPKAASKARAATAVKAKAKAAPARKAPAKAKPPAKPATKAAAKPAAKPAPPVVAKPVVKSPPAPLPPMAVPHASNNGDFASLPVEQLRKVKSGLSSKDRAHFRQLLLEKRAELVGDVKSMHDGARQASGGNLSHMPVHMADIGSDNYDQEFTLGLVESEAKLLREIDEALIRIREGYYGVCMVSGKPIARARLEAKPWAKFSIEVAREMERRGLR